MINLLKKYFIDPIYTGVGYNLYNTLVYGLILGIAIILSFKIVEKFKIQIDFKFLLALIPFLILGSMLRTLEDAAILPITAFLISPGIFFTIFGIVILASAVAYVIQKKIGYNCNIVLGIIGLVILFYPAFLIFKNVQIYFPLFYISLALIASTVSILGIIKYCNISYLEGLWVKIIIAAHMFDTSATVVAVEIYGYWEEHYIEGSIIESMGTSLILYPLKVLVLFTVIYMIQKILDDKNTISFWYLSIFILGFSPGLRDLLKIMLIG